MTSISDRKKENDLLADEIILYAENYLTTLQLLKQYGTDIKAVISS